GPSMWVPPALSFLFIYFVERELAPRRILHCNVTAQPTADWTMQQLREAIPSDHTYRFLIHDRHATFSSELDTAIAPLGVRALKTPVRTPQAKVYASYCSSCAPSTTYSGKRPRWGSFIPWALRGGFGPGSSYSHSFLSHTG